MGIFLLGMSILDSASYIASTSTHVRLVNEGVEKAAEFVAGKLADQSIRLQAWKSHFLNPKEMNESTLNW